MQTGKENKTKASLLEVYESHIDKIRSILHIVDKDFEPLKKFLEEHPHFINGRIQGMSVSGPLSWAVAMNNINFAKWLIEKGAKVNYSLTVSRDKTFWGHTFLHDIIISRPWLNGYEMFQMFQFLLENGANPNVFINGKGEGEEEDWNCLRITPLHLAILSNKESYAEALLKAKADPNLTTGRETPLELAIRKRSSVGILKALIAAKADPNISNSSDPPLVKLITWGFDGSGRESKDLLDAVKSLIEAGARPNKGDKKGVTALHLYAEKGCAKIAKYLIEKGADPELSDASGKNFKDYAKSGSNPSQCLAVWKQYILEQGENAPVYRDTYQALKEDYFLPEKSKSPDNKTNPSTISKTPTSTQTTPSTSTNLREKNHSPKKDEDAEGSHDILLTTFKTNYS